MKKISYHILHVSIIQSIYWKTQKVIDQRNGKNQESMQNQVLKSSKNTENYWSKKWKKKNQESKQNQILSSFFLNES